MRGRRGLAEFVCRRRGLAERERRERVLAAVNICVCELDLVVVLERPLRGDSLRSLPVTIQESVLVLSCFHVGKSLSGSPSRSRSRSSPRLWRLASSRGDFSSLEDFGGVSVGDLWRLKQCTVRKRAQ